MKAAVLALIGISFWIHPELAAAVPAATLRVAGDGVFAFTAGGALPELPGVARLGRAGDDSWSHLVAIVVGADGAALHHLPHGQTQWRRLAGWDADPQRSAGVATARGWVWIGAGAAAGSPSPVVLLRPANQDGEIELSRLPDLPAPAAAVAVAALGDTLHVVASLAGPAIHGNAHWSLDLNRPAGGWTAQPAWPGEPGIQLNLVALHRSLYLFSRIPGGTVRAAVHHPLRGWKPLRDAPVDIAGSAASPCGDSHIVFIGTPDDPAALVGYHAITDGWARMGELPAAGDVLGALPSGDTRFEALTAGGAVQVQAMLQPTRYGWPDHLVLVAFMAAMVGVGVYLSRRERTKLDYFRGGRHIPFWASGLSLFATGASGISLMAMPGRAFEENWAYLTLSFFIAATYPLVLFVYVPIARRLNVSTSNEYLERRYNLVLRLAGSVVYSLNQILARLAAIMLLPAIAISAIAGIPMETSILIMGLVTTVYATLGGLEGVIWTDVIQAVVMLVAVFLCAAWALASLHMAPVAAFATIEAAGKLRSFDLSLSLLGPTSLVLFANVVATTIAMIGDQNFIQRVQCTPTEKDARKAVLTQISVAVPLNVVLFSLGTILFLFYRERPEMLNPTLKADGIFPLFAAQNLPAGLAGLVIAALFAATMSTLSSAINSTANLGVEDFYRRLNPRATPRGCLRLGRGLTFCLGVLGTFAAIALLKTDLRSVWDLAIMLTGMILAPVAGIFFLGIFTVRAHTAGVLIGGASAVAVTYAVKTFSPIHHFLYLPVGVATCVLVGYLASVLLPARRKDLKGLTAFTIYQEPSDSP